MEVYKRKNNLLDSTFGGEFSLSPEENADQFIQIIKRTMNACFTLLENDFKQLDGRSLYNYLLDLYYIDFQESDCLRLLSMLYGKKYTGVQSLPTTMTFTELEIEGHGEHIGCYRELYQVYLDAATSEDFPYQFGRVYSVSELKQFIGDQRIVPLSKTSYLLNGNPTFTTEEEEELPTLNIPKFDSYYLMEDFAMKHFDLFERMLRRKFTKNRVLKDIHEILNELYFDMMKIFSCIDDEYYRSDIVRLCKDWYDSSEEKETFQKVFMKCREDSKEFF